MTTAHREILVCDTSFLGVASRPRTNANVALDWPPDAVSRINSATLAISVVTEAEIRAGWITANWGERRIAEHAQALASLLRFPLDDGIVERWADLAAARKARGRPGISDNDLWIAATAVERGCPLVSCDHHHGRDMPLLAAGLEVIFLPPSPVGGGS